MALPRRHLSGGTGDVVEALRNDHRSLEEAFERYEAVGVGDRSGWFDRLREALVRHEAAEELAVYPAVKGHAPWLDRLLDDRLAEQGEAHELIARLETVNPGTDEFHAGLLALRRAALDHVRHEERTIFEYLELEMSETQRAAMADRYERAKHGASRIPSRAPR